MQFIQTVTILTTATTIIVFAITIIYIVIFAITIIYIVIFAAAVIYIVIFAAAIIYIVIFAIAIIYISICIIVGGDLWVISSTITLVLFLLRCSSVLRSKKTASERALKKSKFLIEFILLFRKL